jgi:gamma-glutamyl hercynylcysteine S-oxide synthase
MASTAPAKSKFAVRPSPEDVIAALGEARERTLALVSHLDERQLCTVHSPIMSPLVWDLGHIAAYEDLWLGHRHCGLPLLREELAETYDAFETPRDVRGEIELLGPREARAYMDEVRERVADGLLEVGAGDGAICEMVIRHELQHSETMRQTMAIAGLLPRDEPPLERWQAEANAEEAAGGRIPAGSEPEWLEVPAGSFEMGADRDGFAYDNERPRHTIELPAFAIARRPVTNASWARFSGRAVGEHPDAPVCHVSWFEAQEYATASGARLPSEAEWEKAATSGLLAGVGRVWEWTSSTFGGYPGFQAHPYREYSEVFFGDDYRVLRGGSWATSERVKTLTFRNWDLPQRRQIFAGLRLARDGEAA